MAIRKYPFDNMEQFFDQMRREMLSGWNRPFGNVEESDSRWSESTTGTTDSWDAGISIEQTDGGFVVLADLPGFERDELSLRLTDDSLVISGEHEVGGEFESRRRTVHERISLPAHVTPEDVHATYRNGVLEVAFTVEEMDSSEGTVIDIE